MGRLAARPARAALLAGFLLLAAGAHTALAQGGDYANVKAEAICVVSGNRMDINAYLAKAPEPGPGPFVWGLTFYIEQVTPGSPGFGPVGNALPAPGFPYIFGKLEEDELWNVAAQSFRDICAVVSPAASAIRGVVVIEVVNANPDGPGGTLRTARCKSIPNPCRK